MLQWLGQSSCFMETVFQEVQRNTDERWSYAASDLTVFTNSTENRPSLLEFDHSQVSESQKPTLIHDALGQSSHGMGAKQGLGSGSQPLCIISAWGPEHLWSVQRQTAPISPPPALCFASGLPPSRLPAGLRSVRGVTAPVPLHSQDTRHNSTWGLSRFLGSENLG